MEWEIYAKKTGTLKIIVWRPTNKAGEESKRTIVDHFLISLHFL
jgi:hypothetical protein